ncbi:MAG: acyl dehydratase [Achromobacter sp.]|uniref:MaoC/PaaZ C-terminal domain-containing protein n=1 Tax=Achromobacter TaxID=222 RepID=UPI0006833A1C|nr:MULTISPECIES: MaoC/PaaZ C-terminal domain-containing protein [Achromobacter]KNY06723.1 acyl dehydratase [Achromobacter piechaudii]MPS81207.1 acyl dehydratase [Achromobacter sp.]
MQSASPANPLPLPPPTCLPSLEVGHRFESAGRTITESDIVNFACLSGDFNRLHVDDEYARTTPFGQRIAHGLLVLSVLSGLTTQSNGYRQLEPYVLALIDINCRFPKPTFIGDTIVVRVTVTEKTEQYRPGKDKVVFRREAVNQRGDVVVQADFAMVLRSLEGSA